MAATSSFCNETTGEWNRLSAASRDTITRITCDVVAEERARLAGHRPVLAWVGITGHTVAECLQHLRCAIACGADGVVLAPLSVVDSPGVVALLQGPVTDCMGDAGRHVPLLLYDNAAITADGGAPHLRTRDVKRLSRLDHVVGIKVSALARVLGSYTRGARHFNERHAFAVYVGNAFDIVSLFRPRQELVGVVNDHWRRYWLQASRPDGVVSGHANVLPREWQRAWLACERGEVQAMETMQQVLQALRAATRFSAGGATHKRTIACLKLALKIQGVISDASVAPGTPSLSAAQQSEFARRFAEIQATVQTVVEPRWRSLQ